MYLPRAFREVSRIPVFIDCLKKAFSQLVLPNTLLFTNPFLAYLFCFPRFFIFSLYSGEDTWLLFLLRLLILLILTLTLRKSRQLQSLLLNLLKIKMLPYLSLHQRKFLPLVNVSTYSREYNRINNPLKVTFHNDWSIPSGGVKSTNSKTCSIFCYSSMIEESHILDVKIDCGWHAKIGVFPPST